MQSTTHSFKSLFMVEPPDAAQQRSLVLRKVFAVAESAYLSRNYELLAQSATILAAFPGFAHAVLYYAGLALQHGGDGNLEAARNLFTQALELAPTRFQGRILLSLGAVNGYQSEHDGEAICYGRILSLTDGDPYSRIEARRGFALIRSIERNHQKSIEILESLLPETRAVARYYPQLLPLCLNDLAIEYQCDGKIERAESAIALARSHPYARFYPEFEDTAREVAEAKMTPRVFLDRHVCVSPKVTYLARQLRVSKIAVAEQQLVEAKRSVVETINKLREVRLRRIHTACRKLICFPDHINDYQIGVIEQVIIKRNMDKQMAASVMQALNDTRLSEQHSG